MKYCPYCGVAIIGGAAVFCAECGKKLPSVSIPQDDCGEISNSPASLKKPSLANVKKTRPYSGKVDRPISPRKRLAAKIPLSTLFRPSKRAISPRKLRQNPLDEEYDGYYDDVRPVDDGCVREKIDPVLIKRIIILFAGAFIIVIIMLVLMYVL